MLAGGKRFIMRGGHAANRIIDDVGCMSRIVYDVTGKQPSSV
jgi:GMP synthase PP-ATPase subunit